MDPPSPPCNPARRATKRRASPALQPRSPLSSCLQDPFSDPSQASLTCLATRPVTIKEDKEVAGSEGHEIFSERKGLNLFQNKASLSVLSPAAPVPYTSGWPGA